MGISFSSSHSSPPSPSPSPSCGMDELPESCVALIMEYLDPPQICKLATLTRTFRAASSADFVWESKLPSNYHVLVRQIFNGLPTDFKNGKRGIYSALCRTNTFDGGTKKLWLDKNIGKLCMCIAAKGLSITGISDRRYWNYIPTEESRRNEFFDDFYVFELTENLNFYHLAKHKREWGSRLRTEKLELRDYFASYFKSKVLLGRKDSVPSHTFSKSGGLKWTESGVPIPSRNIQLVLQTTSRATLQEIWPTGLQHGTCSWLGCKACKVPAMYFRWPVCFIPVFSERTWQMELLPWWQFCCGGWKYINKN
ncbi:hypothetical protein Ahy_A01g002317 isoform B [Arachis hypogaea]|uniref:F-box domain-containing protein n=1 Tax=Arachis hypogaea TaxID=3818 RepID=A0A445EQU1_ARAHY|nr:hypothetical protein Ahy_A01g002317 isoform B [Arachis hypogaea]